MIIISKFSLYAFAFSAGILIFFLGVTSYYYIKDIPQVADLTFKYIAENFIFYAILFNIILFYLLRRIAVKSTKILAQLDKIIELSKTGNYNVVEYLKKLGQLGEKINFILFQFTQLNLMKSLKISAQSNINEFLIAKVNERLLILDMQGNILNISQPFLDLFGLAKDQLVNKNLKEIIKDLNFEQLLQDMKKERKAVLLANTIVEIKEKKEIINLSFQPVADIKNNISNIIVIGQ
jgi:PAS domain S-box-containing protein